MLYMKTENTKEAGKLRIGRVLTWDLNYKNAESSPLIQHFY